MLQYRTAGQIEAEFIALKRAAERAGSALGCSFGSAAEFEADVIRSRIEQGLLRMPRRRRASHYVAALTLLIAVLAWAMLVF